MLGFIKNDTAKNKVRLAYMCFVVIYMAIREVTPLQILIDNIFVSLGVFAIGFMLVLWDLFTSCNCLKGKGIDFLVLFLLICILSSVVNYKYGIGGNIKAIGAFILQYFVFYACGTGLTHEQKQKELTVLSRVITIIWGIFAYISIHMYVFNVEYVVKGGSWGKTTQGFSVEYQRLWGIFQDSNYASFISLIAIFASAYLILTRKKLVTYIFGILSMLVQFSYIVLAGSRAAKILLLLSVFLVSICWLFKQKQNLKKTLVSTVLTAVFLVATYFGYTAFQYILPTYKNFTSFLLPNEVEVGVVRVYDSVYDFTKVPVIENLLVLPDSQPKPPTSNEENPNENLEDENPNAINRVDTNKEDLSNGRFKRWKNTLEVFMKAPIIGTSPRNVSTFAKEHAPNTLMALYGIAPHNGYLDVLVGTGLLGMAAMGGFLLVAAIELIKKIIREKSMAYIIFCSAAVLVLAGASVFISDVYMVFTLGSVFFFTLLGYAVNGEQIEKEPCVLKIFNLIFCKKKTRN